MAKRKSKKQEFEYLVSPAKLLAMRQISPLEKNIVADVGFFDGDGYQGYTISNADMAKKFGVSRRTIINAIQRLRSNKLQMIKDVGVDEYHRCLKLGDKVSSLFEGGNGEIITPPKQGKKFQKPTPTEATEYAHTISFQLDGERFVKYYEDNGWVTGKNKTPMKDWQAAIRYWKRRENNGSSKSSGSNQSIIR